MNRIIRTKTEAKGGITDAERLAMKEHTEKWIGIALQTGRCDKQKLTEAIHGIYAAANLKKPRVVVAASPLAMAMAYGAASAIWYQRGENAKIKDMEVAATSSVTREKATKDEVQTPDAAITQSSDMYTRTEVHLSNTLETSAIEALLGVMDTTAEINEVSFSIPHESAVRATDSATRTAVGDATAMRVLSETSLTTYDAASNSLLDTFKDKTLAVDATPRLPVAAVHPDFSFKNTEATDYATRWWLDLTTDTNTNQVTYMATIQALMAAVSLYDGVDTGPWPTDSTISFEVNLAMDKIFSASSEATDLMTRDDLNYENSFSDNPAVFLRGVTVHSVGEAMYSPKTTPEQQAAQACFDAAGPLGLACAKRWTYAYQGGNMWAGYATYASAFRDILGLDLPEYKAFAHYEAAVMHGGFRVMHEEFCIVSDFPDVIKRDEANLPHCEDGPSHKWSDGWSLYHWHGVKVPAEWIENKASLTAKDALAWSNIEQRRAACEILGWEAVVAELNPITIDKDSDPEIGTLLEVVLPDSGKERFIYVKCGTSRFFALPVPLNMETALQANAWTYGLDEGTYKPEVRT